MRRVDARIEEFNSEAGRIALPVRLRRVHAPFDEKRRAASFFRVKREPDHPLHLNAAMGKLIQLLRAVRKPIHGQMFKDLVATTLPDPAIEREAKGLGSRYEKTLRHRRWAIELTAVANQRDERLSTAEKSQWRRRRFVSDRVKRATDVLNGLRGVSQYSPRSYLPAPLTSNSGYAVEQRMRPGEDGVAALAGQVTKPKKRKRKK